MIVEHTFATPGGLPPMPEGLLYQYVVAANGIFVRAWRPGLAAIIPVSEAARPYVRGLIEVWPAVHLEMAVPLKLTARMFELAYRAGRQEILFYLTGGSRETNKPWRLVVPEQLQSAGSVEPVDPASGADALIEVHSHHEMQAFFSLTDDEEEQTGFRVYGVIGGLGYKRPQFRVRVGIYGHFGEIPAGDVFCLPPGEKVQTFGGER